VCDLSFPYYLVLFSDKDHMTVSVLLNFWGLKRIIPVYFGKVTPKIPRVCLVPTNLSFRTHYWFNLWVMKLLKIIFYSPWGLW
jgi:hypothetical protein